MKVLSLIAAVAVSLVLAATAQTSLAKPSLTADVNGSQVTLAGCGWGSTVTLVDWWHDNPDGGDIGHVAELSTSQGCFSVVVYRPSGDYTLQAWRGSYKPAKVWTSKPTVEITFIV